MRKKEVKKMPVIAGTGTMTIEEAVCHRYSITIDEIKSQSRKKELVDARRILVWYYVNVMRLTQVKAGALIERDHATARNLLITFLDYYAADKAYRKDIDDVFSNVRSYQVNNFVPRYTRNDMVDLCSKITGLPEKCVSERIDQLIETSN